MHLFDHIEERDGQAGTREGSDPWDSLSHKDVQKIVSFVGSGQARKAMAVVRVECCIAFRIQLNISSIRSQHVLYLLLLWAFLTLTFLFRKDIMRIHRRLIS